MLSRRSRLSGPTPARRDERKRHDGREFASRVARAGAGGEVSTLGDDPQGSRTNSFRFYLDWRGWMRLEFGSTGVTLEGEFDQAIEERWIR